MTIRFNLTFSLFQDVSSVDLFPNNDGYIDQRNVKNVTVSLQHYGVRSLPCSAMSYIWRKM